MEPATVIRWHREGLTRFWNRKSRAGRRGGHPALGRKVIELIRNELAKLGIEVAVSSVARYMVREQKPPSPPWRAFLGNHLQDLVAIDFFVLPTATFGVLFG